MNGNTKLPHLLRHGDFLNSMMDASFQAPEADIKYHKSFFAFVDILGFKSLLEDQGDNAPLIIFKTIKDTYQFHRSSYESIKLKILSDSILVWSDSDDQICFWNVINVVEMLQASFLKSGILTRGGIAHGNNFIHNDIIVSPALVSAYQLEQRAKTPRILIDEEAKKIGFNNLLNHGHRRGILHKGFFRVCNPDSVSLDDDGENIIAPFICNDGVFCLKYGIPSWYFSGDTLPTPEQISVSKESGIQTLNEIRKNIIRSRPSTFENDKIKEKHLYVARKFNQLVKSLKIDNNVMLLSVNLITP